MRASETEVKASSLEPQIEYAEPAFLPEDSPPLPLPVFVTRHTLEELMSDTHEGKDS